MKEGNRRKTHRQSRRTRWTKGTRSSTNTLQFIDQMVIRRCIIRYIRIHKWPTRRIDIKSDDKLMLVFCISNSVNKWQNVFRFFTPGTVCQTNDTALLTEMKTALVNCIILWCVLHTDHPSSLGVKDFLSCSVGRNSSSVTERSNRPHICLMGNVSEM